MGSGIAHVFARSGFRVLLCDVEQRFLARAQGLIRTNLEREAAKGKLAAGDVDAALGRIQVTTEREALAEADIVVEAAPERFETESGAVSRAGPDPAHEARGSGDQYLVDLDHEIGGDHSSGRTGCDRHALLQPRAGDDAGGGGARHGDQRCDVRHCARLGGAAGQDAGRGQRRARSSCRTAC